MSNAINDLKLSLRVWIPVFTGMTRPRGARDSIFRRNDEATSTPFYWPIPRMEDTPRLHREENPGDRAL